MARVADKICSSYYIRKRAKIKQFSYIHCITRLELQATDPCWELPGESWGYYE